MRAETFLIGFIIFDIAWMIFVFIHHARKKEKQQKNDPCHIDADHWVKGKTISIGYSGTARYINGREIKTCDEWDEWGVIKGFSMNISGHLKELERKMLDGRCDNYAAAKSEWHSYYSRLRKLCIQHCLWNPMLDDHAIFKPTTAQAEAEKQLFRRIDAACATGIDTDYQRSSRKEEILSYITSKNGHVVRKSMVNHFCGADDALKREYRRICNEMVASGILMESHNDKGQLTLKIKRQSKKKQNVQPQLAPSTFVRIKYENLSPKLYYKVKHTVGAPLHVDKTNNRCEFVSLSTGERYYTSLSQCTCPAYHNNEPCKHMVALAKHLGYL